MAQKKEAIAIRGASAKKPKSSSNINSMDGRRRVIITNVSPQVEKGQFPAKTVIEEDTVIAADIFSDGHDEIKASVFVKHKEEKLWQELPMQLLVNDHWQAIWLPQKLGFYQFKIQAWVDHFTTWQKGLQKKYRANQDIHIDLLIGAEMLDEAALNADAKTKKQLQQWSKELQTSARNGAGVSLALSHQLSEAVMRAGNKSLSTMYPQVFLVEVERRKAVFSTWYEMFPRSSAAVPGKHGTFKDVERLLPRIAHMGFDTLYFPPIHPIGEIKRKGKNNALTAGPEDPGSPWAIGNKNGGHKAIHPQLGTLRDFKQLVKKAKQRDIDIALDIAFQCAPDHPYVKEHPEWFTWRPDGSVQYAENPPKKYEDILPINFESEDWQNLWEELKSIVEYWIAQGVDIFRVDNPHTKAFPFWEWMIKEVKKNHPQTIFLAEAFTRPRLMERLAKVGFTQSYTYFTWRNTKEELEEYMNELTKTALRYYFRPNFWPNTPDILPPILTYGGENAHIQRLVLAATLSSSYGIYGPVYEFGINTPHEMKEEYIDNEKYEIKHWDWSQYTRIEEIIARVNRIRKENRALQSIWNIVFAPTSNEQVICYGKADAKSKNIVITVVNLDPYHTQGAHVRIPVEQLGIVAGVPYQLKDLLSGNKYTWQEEWNYVELNPYEMPAHIFKVEQQNY